MGMRDLEKKILEEARLLTKNPKLKMKDIMEWSSGTVKPQEGEIVHYIPSLGVTIAVKKAA